MQIRRLSLDDHLPSYLLAVEAFGGPPSDTPPPEPPAQLPAGREGWVALDDGLLVARIAALEFESWWHGAAVPTCGIAAVAVAAERRGEGLLHGLFDAALGAARERGEVLSTLYPTANGIYRSFGYELVSSYDTVEIPTAELGRVRPPTATRTRRATVADLPAVRATYASWASAQNGPLTRTGPRFGTTDEEQLAEVTATTLAVDADDRVVGYATWDRGQGYDPSTAHVQVWDLVAVTLDAYRALWTVLGSFSSVAGKIRLRTSGDDPARLVLPTAAWDVVGRHPYMLRVSDVAGAFTAAGLGLAGLAPTTVGFAVAGDRFGQADGTYRLALGEEPAVCERVTTGSVDVPTFTPQGLALKYAGAQSCANLRMTDHLAGPTDHDALLDAVLGGRPLHVRDYF